MKVLLTQRGILLIKNKQYQQTRRIIARKRCYQRRPPAPKRLAISSLEEKTKGMEVLNKPPPSSKKWTENQVKEV